MASLLFDNDYSASGEVSMPSPYLRSHVATPTQRITCHNPQNMTVSYRPAKLPLSQIPAYEVGSQRVRDEEIFRAPRRGPIEAKTAAKPCSARQARFSAPLGAAPLKR